MSHLYRSGKMVSGQYYGSGETLSRDATDELIIGPYCVNQTFWEVTKANMPILYNAAFQGIIGVGPPETPAADAWNALLRTAGNITNATDNHTKVDESLLLQAADKLEVALEVTARPTLLRNLNVSMFSMCVSRTPGSDGFFIWNDNTALKKPLLFAEVPVVGTHTWSVELKSVRLKGLQESEGSKNVAEQIGCKEGCSAIIDSGTSLLAVPSFIIERLQDMMEKLDSDCSNIHELPSLVFNMGDGTFTLPPDAYVAEVVGQLPNYLEGYTTINDTKNGLKVRSVVNHTVDSEADESQEEKADSELDPLDSLGLRSSRSRCQLLLMESYASTKYGPLWILGIPFFRRYYTTFRIGESHSQRTLFMAPSTDDCYVEGAEAQDSKHASLLEVTGPTDVYLRRIKAEHIHVPPLAQKALKSDFLHL